MVVGLHCISPDVVGLDREEAADMGEGNILPFYENSQGKAMETWRQHRRMIRAMAVVPDKYLISFSLQKNDDQPDAAVLWDLTDPGVVLRRHNFWDSSRSLFEQSLTRLNGICGIAVDGNDILLTDTWGDRIVAVKIEEHAGSDPDILIHGYGRIGNRYCEEDSMHGRMAMCGSSAVMANEGFDDIWLFDIKGNNDCGKLDPREGGIYKFDISLYQDDDDDDEEETYKYKVAGRGFAIGRLKVPLFGDLDTEKKSKRQKIENEMLTTIRTRNMASSRERSQPKERGEGGPVSVAVGGGYIVAGFSNGTILHSPLLPKKFQTRFSKNGTNEFASCSYLPPCEWHIPRLESKRDEYSDDDNDNDDG